MQVGIVGGGQLARMMALAGAPLGLRCSFLDPKHDACAAPFGTHLSGAYDDPNALHRLARRSDCLTWDFENAAVEPLRAVSHEVPVRPDLAALQASQDRLAEKRVLNDLDVPTARFHAVGARPDLLEGVDRVGLPAVLKTRRMGYDGKGQALLRRAEDYEPAWRKLGGSELILEEFVPFDWECSLIAVRGIDGEIRYYPLTHNVHHEGVLSVSRAPVTGAGALETIARGHLERLLTHFGYVGVLAVEFFVVDGRLIANEIAPRVHNSGHWTIDGAVTSQFENHLRAVCGLPLGDTGAHAEALMVNWIGTMPQAAPFLRIPGLHWHSYDKQPQPGRKLGHATIAAADSSTLAARIQALRPLLGGSATGAILDRLCAGG